MRTIQDYDAAIAKGDYDTAEAVLNELESAKMASNPDVVMEEAMTAARQGDVDTAKAKLNEYATATGMSEEGVAAKVNANLNGATPLQPGTMTNNADVSLPSVKDAPRIYADRELGKQASADSSWKNAMLEAGYGASKFGEGIGNIKSAMDYLAEPVATPINSLVRSAINATGLKSSDEALRESIPAYKSVRDSILGERSLQDLLLPVADRNKIIEDYATRNAKNDDESAMFSPYSKHSGIGGFAGAMMPYIPLQILGGPLFSGAIKGLTGAITDATKVAANTTGRAIKSGADAIERTNIPLISYIITKAKADYGAPFNDLLAHYKNASKLPADPFSAGKYSQAATAVVQNATEAGVRTDQDALGGALAGLMGNRISSALTGRISRLPSRVSPFEQEVLDWAYKNGYQADAGLKIGDKGIQESLKGLENSHKYGRIAQAFYAKQDDVKNQILQRIMGVPKSLRGQMTHDDWNKFWGKDGLGGEMDFRDANTSASFGINHRTALSDLIASLDGNALPGPTLASKQLKTLQNMLSNRANPVGPFGPNPNPIIPTNEMKDVLQEFNALRQAYKASDVPSRLSAVQHLDKADSILQGMVNDVQVPKGLTLNNKPFDMDYIKDLNARYAIASTINENALNATGTLNPRKLFNKLSDDPDLLKRALRGIGNERQKDLSNLVSLIGMEGKRSGSSLTGSPVTEMTRGNRIKHDEESFFSQLPVDIKPSLLDTIRTHKFMSGYPITTGYLNLKNDMGILTPYGIGRNYVSATQLGPKVERAVQDEKDAYDYYNDGAGANEKHGMRSYLSRRADSKLKEYQGYMTDKDASVADRALSVALGIPLSMGIGAKNSISLLNDLLSGQNR